LSKKTLVRFPVQKGNTVREVLARFVGARRRDLCHETAKRYERLTGLWLECLDRYGLRYLSSAERALWRKRCSAGARVTAVFGPDLLVRSAVPFLGEYAIREFGTQLPLLEYAGTVVRKLAKWLLEEGLILRKSADSLWRAGTKARRELVSAAVVVACINVQYGNRYELRRPFCAPLFNVRAELYEVLPGGLRFAVKGRTVEVELPECVTELCRPGWVFTLRMYRKGLSWGLAGAENVNIFGWQNEL